MMLKRRLPRACLCWPAASSFTPVRVESIHRFGLASPLVAGWATRASWSLPSANLPATVSISLVGLGRTIPIARPGLCILLHSRFRYNVLSGARRPHHISIIIIKLIAQIAVMSDNCVVTAAVSISFVSAIMQCQFGSRSCATCTSLGLHP